MTKKSRLTISHDDAVDIPEGETRYYVLLSDDDMEGLRIGVVSLSLRRRARALLDWKDDEQRLDEEREERLCAQTESVVAAQTSRTASK